ncbi:MAG: tetratricopeptide repeat protein [Armatimonas sp.]
MALPAGTVTFLFTDIEGSTKLWEAYPEEMRVALARHDALMRHAIEIHKGHVFKTVGDAFCAAFPTAPEALTAALKAQQALVQEVWPTPVTIKVRMALHTGAVESRDNDYFGQPLNRVARLLSTGYGGQSLLSRVTYDLVRDFLPQQTALRDLGEHRLKDLARPEQIFQLIHPGLPGEFPPLKSLDSVSLPNNLPQQVTSFIGREKELTRVQEALSKSRLLTLTGAGGSGKSRLSLQAAADVLEQYPDGIWLVELAPLADAALVAQTVASVLGVKEQAGQPITQALTGVLKEKNLLLLLDNCEHLLAACSQLVAALIRACPHITVLATSREALGIGGEQIYRVPSLSLPNPKASAAATAESLSQFEAVRLFIDRAQAVRPDFVVTNASAPALAQLCFRLDGIPMAIELAAARVRSLAVEQINDKLDSRFRLLTGGDRSALPRQQTLRALIDWSYDLLADSEKTLLARLSVFAGGWTLEAAEAVVGFDPIEDWEVLDLLTSLADKSLILSEETPGEQATRYRMLETIRQYAAECLSGSGEVGVVQERHMDFFVVLAEEAQTYLRGPDQIAWLNRLEIEHDNLRATLENSAAEITAKAMLSGLRLSGLLWYFWYIRGYVSEGREHLARALARRQAIEQAAATMDLADTALVEAAVPRALQAAGDLAFIQVDYGVAWSLLEEALTLYREIGSKPNIAHALMNLGGVAINQGDYSVARQLLVESLALCREIGDKSWTSNALTNLSNISYYQSDYSEAWSLMEEGLALYREIDDRHGTSNALMNLGYIATYQGNYGAARRLLEEALALYREFGNKLGIAITLDCMAKVCALGEDNARQAAMLWAAENTLRQSIGVPRTPPDQKEQEVQMAQARATLNDEVAWTAAWSEGAALSWEQAVKLALCE